MKITFELETIQMPNFLRIKSKPGTKQEGLKEVPAVPIGDLSEDEAAEYAQEMYNAFIQHWDNKRSE